MQQLKQEKASKERINEFKFKVNNDAKSLLAKLDEKYSSQVMSFDREKVHELEVKLDELKRSGASQEEIAKVKEEIQRVSSLDDTPLYALRHYTDKEIADRVMAAADILGLVPYLKRKPAALSGGQRQRVALGRAIVRNPKVFLMDEPLSNLDAKLRVQTRSEIIKIHERVGATTIYVTHDQTEAMTMADRIVVMRDGYIQQIDTPEEIYNNPSNIFVAGFIGNPAMNFLNGTFDGKNICLNSEDGNVSVALKLNKEQNKLLEPYQDKEIVVGIRPEFLHVKGDAKLTNCHNYVDLCCEFRELMGYD